MAAFLLVSDRSEGYDLNSALAMLFKQCMTQPVKFTLPGWTLYLFPKYLVQDHSNHRHSPPFSLFATGSPYLPGRTYSESLEEIFTNAQRGCFKPDIKGIFFILFSDGINIRFTTDSSGIYPIYHSSDGKIVSSSFLAIAEGLPGLTPSKEIITENLLTGTIIGSETIFSEIKRFEPSLPFSFTGLDFFRTGDSNPGYYRFKNRKASLLAQIEAVDNVFKNMKTFASETGIDAGITGGFDSRLLFSMLNRHMKGVSMQFHSHLRKQRDKDYISGKEICRVKGVSFVETPVTDVSDLNENQVGEALERGMIFCDGQIRTHAFWHEEYNTSEYRIRTLNNKKLGLGGIGGEQYRNQERMLLPSVDMFRWVKNDLLIKYSGLNSAKKRVIDVTADTVKGKIAARLNLSRKDRMTLFEMKRFVNEIYIPFNRGLKSGYENRLSFFLFPFTDKHAEQTALSATPFLGASLNYQAEMIKLIDPEIAEVITSYSFSFSKGEKLFDYLPAVWLRNFTPWSFRIIIEEKVLKRETVKWADMMCKFKYLNTVVSSLEALGLPLSFGGLLRRTDTGPLVFALGHIIRRYESKLYR